MLTDAMRPGIAVEDCVQRLKRYHYVLRRLHAIFIAHIPTEPIYELKMGFSYHAYLCAEHVTAFAGRVAEMREPPLGLDAVPDPAFAFVFDKILAAPTTPELLIGVYEVALPALQEALEQHQRDTNLSVRCTTGNWHSRHWIGPVLAAVFFLYKTVERISA